LACKSKFVVVSVPRSGSWHLIELLNGHPEIVANGEILNPEDTSWGDPESRDGASFDELINFGFSGVQRRPKSRITSVGFKVLQNQITRSITPELFLRQLARIKDLRIILLRRRNSLEVLRSTVQATLSKQWIVHEGVELVEVPPIFLSFQQCREFFLRCDQYFSEIRQLFANHPLLEVTYESVVRDVDVELARVQQFLKVKLMQLPPSGLRRQETRPLHVTLHNFAALEEAFRGSPHHQFFNMEDT
jgi:hypothetical protein